MSYRKSQIEKSVIVLFFLLANEHIVLIRETFIQKLHITIREKCIILFYNNDEESRINVPFHLISAY